MSVRHRPPAGRSLRHVGETRLNSPMTVDRAQIARTPVAVGPPGPPGVDASAGPHVPTHLAGGSDPLPWVDLPEGIPADPPLDHARLYALDVNGYTQVEMRDGAAKVVRFASDNVLIGKVTDPAGVARGTCVYLAGATGANPEVRLARADDLATMPAIGLALDTGVLNGFIRVLIGGTLALLNTSAFAEGDRLYVSATTAGALTTTLPLAPAFGQRVGFVTRSHATAGEVLVLTTATAIPPRLHHETHEPGGSDELENAAWTNVANVFTAQPQTLSANGSAILDLIDTSQAANARVFRINNAVQGLFFTPRNDDLTVVNNGLFLTRAGNAFVAADLYEKGRTTPMGHWQDVAYSAGNFGAPSGLWTVEAGDVAVNRYTLVGKTLTWRLDLQTTSLSAPTPTVGIVLPAGMLTGASGARGVCKVADGATWQHADISAAASSSFLSIGRIDFANWPAVTNGFYLYLSVTCEVL